MTFLPEVDQQALARRLALPQAIEQHLLASLTNLLAPR
jgi:hypothetical protein